MSQAAQKIRSLATALVLAGISAVSSAAPVIVFGEGDFLSSDWKLEQASWDLEDHGYFGSQGLGVRFNLGRDVGVQALEYSPALALNAGASYTLSFWLNSEFNGSDPFAQFNYFKVGLGPVAFDTAKTTANEVSTWVQYSYDFTVANDTAFTLSFASAPNLLPQGASGTIFLDDISLVRLDAGCTANCNPVPEPGTAALVGAALMAGVYVSRRRKV